MTDRPGRHGVITTRPLLAGVPRPVFAAGAAALVLVLVLVILAATRGGDGGAAAQPTVPLPSTPIAPTAKGNESNVKVGVFRGTDHDAVDDFETWAGVDVPYVVDFSSRSTWSDIADPQYMLDEWEGEGRRMIYSTAVLPSDQTSTMTSGAQGNYDNYFKRLGRALVAHGQEDAILRLGWEFNLSTSRWKSDDPNVFIAYWRHIVTAMRSVPGEKFQFDWSVNNGDGNRYDATLYYPGNEYVDYIGVDAYDVSAKDGTYPYPAGCDATCLSARQSMAWDVQIYGGMRGLRFWSEYARAKGRPLSLPEWGVWERPDGIGGKDDPAYIQRMFQFIDNPENNVAYQSYFEFDSSDGEAKHRLMTSFPNSAKVYLQLFGKK